VFGFATSVSNSGLEIAMSMLDGDERDLGRTVLYMSDTEQTWEQARLMSKQLERPRASWSPL